MKRITALILMASVLVVTVSGCGLFHRHHHGHHITNAQ